MSITIGNHRKIRLPAIILAQLFLGAVSFALSQGARAQNTLVTFEADELIPGSTPPIQSNWGKQNEDIWRVDNLETYNATGNCFLFDRQENATTGNWGAGLQLPPYKADWISIQLAFKFNGSATEANASLEVRNQSRNRLYYANLGSSKGKDPITLINADNTWVTKAVNHFDRETWNRVTWYIPTTIGKKQTMLLKLESFDHKTKKWHQSGDIAGLEVEVENIPKLFRINFPAATQPIQLRFDDITILTLTNEDMSAIVQRTDKTHLP